MMKTSATTTAIATSVHPQHAPPTPHSLTTGASRAGQEEIAADVSTLSSSSSSSPPASTLIDLKKRVGERPNVQFVFGGLPRGKHIRRASTGSIRPRQSPRSNSITAVQHGRTLSDPSLHNEARNLHDLNSNAVLSSAPTTTTTATTTCSVSVSASLSTDTHKEPQHAEALENAIEVEASQQSLVDAMEDMTELEEELALCDEFDEDVEIREVPDDIITNFFTFLDYKDLCHVSAVCKQWKELASQQFLWEYLFHQRFPNPLLVNIHDEITHTLPLEKNHEVRAQQLWCDAKQKLNARLNEARAHARSSPHRITPQPLSDPSAATDEDISRLLLEGDYRTLFRLNKTRKTCCVSQIDPQTTLYRLEVNPFSEKRGHVYSEPFAAGKDKWRILVFPEGNRCQSLSIYLDVSADINSLDKDFKKPTIYMFIIMNRKQHSLTRMYYIEKNFSMQDRRGEVIDWGLQETLDLNTLRNTPGYLVDDSLMVMALLHVPDGPVLGTSRSSS